MGCLQAAYLQEAIVLHQLLLDAQIIAAQNVFSSLERFFFASVLVLLNLKRLVHLVKLMALLQQSRGR